MDEGPLVFRSRQRSRAYDEYLAEAERVLEGHGGRRYRESENAIRARLARRATNDRIRLLPTAPRRFLARERANAPEPDVLDLCTLRRHRCETLDQGRFSEAAIGVRIEINPAAAFA